MTENFCLPANRWWALVLSVSVLLGACTGGPTRLHTTGDVALTVKQAWVNGEKVDYISTDTSDVHVALEQGLNHVPRLADALGTPPGSRSLLERVYAFPGREQIAVFQSAPVPAGPTNTDHSYSPLWRMVTVKWTPQATVRELRSEEDILQAEDKREVSLVVTGVVINCPVLRTFEALSSH